MKAVVLHHQDLTCHERVGQAVRDVGETRLGKGIEQAVQIFARWVAGWIEIGRAAADYKVSMKPLLVAGHGLILWRFVVGRTKKHPDDRIPAGTARGIPVVVAGKDDMRWPR